jgi:tRNA-specific 2-thiouridylase
VDIDPETSRVIVGDEEDLVRGDFEVDRVMWHAGEPAGTLRVAVKIRYAHSGTDASLVALPGNRARIVLDQPQRAVTPGQAAVFYDGDRVVGGGWIVRQPSPVPA